MYGMVNNAFRRYVIEREGEPAWNEIVDQAGLECSEFAAMAAYDDSVTLSIVGAIASQSNRNIDELLQDVGKSWVAFAKTTPFANLLAMAGKDFEALIANLDEMHARIRTSLPTIGAPSFSCDRQENGLLEVTYRSQREGLFPFVQGIFEGLAADFGQEVEIIDFEPISASSAKWTLKIATTCDKAA